MAFNWQNIRMMQSFYDYHNRPPKAIMSITEAGVQCNLYPNIGIIINKATPDFNTTSSRGWCPLGTKSANPGRSWSLILRYEQVRWINELGALGPWLDLRAHYSHSTEILYLKGSNLCQWGSDLCLWCWTFPSTCPPWERLQQPDQDLKERWHNWLVHWNMYNFDEDPILSLLYDARRPFVLVASSESYRHVYRRLAVIAPPTGARKEWITLTGHDVNSSFCKFQAVSILGARSLVL